jgi:preprotein translocase subunit Sss1
MSDREVTGTIKICVDLTLKEYEEIKQKIKGTGITLYGFVWYAIQNELGKEKD